jgi:hypothetical protein
MTGPSDASDAARPPAKLPPLLNVLGSLDAVATAIEGGQEQAYIQSLAATHLSHPRSTVLAQEQRTTHSITRATAIAGILKNLRDIVFERVPLPQVATALRSNVKAVRDGAGSGMNASSTGKPQVLDLTQRAWLSVFSGSVSHDPPALREIAAKLRGLQVQQSSHNLQVEIVNQIVTAAHRGAFGGAQWDIWRAAFADWPSFQQSGKAVSDFNINDWGPAGSPERRAAFLARLGDLIESFAGSNDHQPKTRSTLRRVTFESPPLSAPMRVVIQVTWIAPDGSHQEGDFIDRLELFEHSYWEGIERAADSHDEFLIEWKKDGKPRWLKFRQDKHPPDFVLSSSGNYVDSRSRLLELKPREAIRWFRREELDLPLELKKALRKSKGKKRKKDGNGR